MRRTAFYAVFTVILLVCLVILFIARQNFNSDYAAASQAIYERQAQIAATVRSGG